MVDRDFTCDAAREALWPDPTGPAALEARQHYDACADCQRFFATQRALGARLGRLAQASASAPDGLRQRILAAVAAEPVAAAGRPRRRWLAVGLAAAAVLALAVGLRNPGQREMAMPFVMEAARVLTPAASFRSSEFAEVEAWLARNTGTEVHVPDITEATLMGGRVVSMNGVPTAAAVFEFNGMPLTYFALPTSGVAGREVETEEGILALAAEGYEVAMWLESNGLRAVVAPMPRDELRAVAAECRNKALRI